MANTKFDRYLQAMGYTGHDIHPAFRIAFLAMSRTLRLQELMGRFRSTAMTVAEYREALDAHYYENRYRPFSAADDQLWLDSSLTGNPCVPVLHP